jgi:membrane-associated phospholipid phosphatase
MFFTLAITTQFVKRITGRQSPFRAMDPPPGTTAVPGGSWHFLISPKNYQKSVSNHDAFPSGHLATAMATVTILAGNYPDNKYIKPVGYTLMGLLGYSMLNNGVHWLSDYPLAIAIGYTCGKIALARGRSVVPAGRTIQRPHRLSARRRGPRVLSLALERAGFVFSSRSPQE